MNAQERKKEIRERLEAARRALTPSERAERSRWLCERLEALPLWRGATVLAAFWPTPAEPDIRPALHRWRIAARGGGRRIAALPRVEQRDPPRLAFYEVRNPETDLRPGPLKILQPDPALCREVPLERLDWIWIPAVGLDLEGARLGRGGGYYDALLARLPREILRAAIVFDCQVSPEPLPRESWDERVDMIVTESRTLETAGASGANRAK